VSHVEFVQYHLRGVGVDPEVVLRGRGDVAETVDVPAHHPHRVQEVVQFGLLSKRERDVRQRRDTDQGDLSGVFPGGVDDDVRTVTVAGFDPGVGEQRPAEAALAVDVVGVLVILQQGSTRSLVDGDVVGDPREVEGVLRVLDFVVERHVAGADRDRLEVDPIGERREQEGLRVVARGVGVDNHAPGSRVRRRVRLVGHTPRWSNAAQIATDHRFGAPGSLRGVNVDCGPLGQRGDDPGRRTR